MSGDRKQTTKNKSAFSGTFDGAEKPVRYNRHTEISQQLYEIGKLPPQAVELEEAVLGAMLIERDAFSQVVDLLSGKVFYKEAHNYIYDAMRALFDRGDPVDILTVTNELKKLGTLEIVGGAYYISQLTNRIASAANVEYHARIIMQKAIARLLIEISSKTIKEAYEDTADVFDLLDSAEQSVFSVAEMMLKKNAEKMPRLMIAAMDEMTAAATSKNGVTGVPSGFIDLDRITGGWQPSDLVIIAARPAMGKTAFVLSIARNAAVDFKRPVAVFSLEMASVQLVKRLISGECEISAQQIKSGQLTETDWQNMNIKITPLCEAPLFIDDTPAISLFELRAKCRRLKANSDIQLIIIDYLQLMVSGDGFNREQEISNISRGLKSLAKELKVPIIALSQLSRAVETRGGDKKPQLSDLRESGAIEQDSDLVLFLHRPEYYGFTNDSEGNSTAGTCEVIVAKHRNGAVGSVQTRFIDRFAKFQDIINPYVPDGNYDVNAGIVPNTEFNPIIPINRGNGDNDDPPF